MSFGRLTSGGWNLLKLLRVNQVLVPRTSNGSLSLQSSGTNVPIAYMESLTILKKKLCFEQPRTKNYSPMTKSHNKKKYRN
jgi:hypothetical protein